MCPTRCTAATYRVVSVFGAVRADLISARPGVSRPSENQAFRIGFRSSSSLASSCTIAAVPEIDVHDEFFGLDNDTLTAGSERISRALLESSKVKNHRSPSNSTS